MGRKPGETRGEGLGPSARVLIDGVIEMMAPNLEGQALNDPSGFSPKTCPVWLNPPRK